MSESKELASKDQLAELFGDTMGRPTSFLDTLTLYRSGKEDYFKRGDEKVADVHGILLYSQRPMRTFWSSAELSDKPPDCWSMDSVRPYAEAAQPQADKCSECPRDKFGTAKVGNGKACKTRAADFLLEVNVNEGMPPLSKTSIPVFELTPARVMGPALVRYSIGNKESANNYAALMRFAKERATYVQGLVCRWGFDRAKSKSGVDFDVVTVTPLAKIPDDDVMKVVVPLVKALKDGQAKSLLESLAGRTDDDASFETSKL